MAIWKRRQRKRKCTFFQEKFDFNIKIRLLSLSFSPSAVVCPYFLFVGWAGSRSILPGWRCPKITYPFNLFVYSGLILFGIDVWRAGCERISSPAPVSLPIGCMSVASWGAKGEECITGYSFCYSSADGCGRERLYRLLDSGFELAVCINMSLWYIVWRICGGFDVNMLTIWYVYSDYLQRK